MIQLPSLPTITLCDYRKFNIGEYHVTRCISDYVLILMLEGTLHFTENEKEVSLHGGDWYIQTPGIKQSAIRPSDSAHYFYAHFKCIEGDSLYLEMNKEGKFMPDQMVDLLDGLLGLRFASDFYRLDYDREFLHLLKQLILFSQKSTPPKLLMVNQVFRLVEENYMHEHLSNFLEEQMHLSYHYMYKVSKAYKGMSPLQYMMQLRLNKAKELLSNTNSTVESIAYDIGFKDISVFYKSFKKHIKMTPLRWRQESRELP